MAQNFVLSVLFALSVPFIVEGACAYFNVIHAVCITCFSKVYFVMFVPAQFLASFLLVPFISFWLRCKRVCWKNFFCFFLGSTAMDHNDVKFVERQHGLVMPLVTFCNFPADHPAPGTKDWFFCGHNGLFCGLYNNIARPFPPRQQLHITCISSWLQHCPAVSRSYFLCTQHQEHPEPETDQEREPAPQTTK